MAQEFADGADFQGARVENVGDATADTDATNRGQVAAMVAAGRTGLARGYTALIGDGTSTSIIVEHGLGTGAIVPSFVSMTDLHGFETDWELVPDTDGNQIRVTFAEAPGTNGVQVTVFGF